jgi:hypothetical protein
VASRCIFDHQRQRYGGSVPPPNMMLCRAILQP